MHFFITSEGLYLAWQFGWCISPWFHKLPSSFTACIVGPLYNWFSEWYCRHSLMLMTWLQFVVVTLGVVNWMRFYFLCCRESSVLVILHPLLCQIIVEIYRRKMHIMFTPNCIFEGYILTQIWFCFFSVAATTSLATRTMTPSTSTCLTWWSERCWTWSPPTVLRWRRWDMHGVITLTSRECYAISDHWQCDCLFNCLCGLTSKKISKPALQTFCEENPL